MAFDGPLWGRRVQITGQNPVATATGFDVVFTHDNIPAEALDGGSRSALNGGGDLRMSLDNAGANQIPLHVIQCTVSVNPSLRRAHLRARFPSYDSANRSVWLFYNRAGQTQPPANDSFGQYNVYQDYLNFYITNSSGAIENVTQNSQWDVTSSGSGTSPSTESPAGLNSTNFDGTSNAVVNISGPAQLSSSGTDPLTFTALIRAANLPNDEMGIFLRDSNQNSGFRFFSDNQNATSPNSDQTYVFQSAGLNTRQDDLGDNALVLNQWTSITFSHEESVMQRGYLNGALNYVNDQSAGGTVGPIDTNSDGFVIGGAEGYVSSNWNGQIWVVKTKVGLSSDDYVALEYDNESSPSTFWTMGEPEDTGGSTGISVSAESQQHDVTFYNATIDLTGEISVSAESQLHSVSFFDASVDLTGEVLVSAEGQQYQTEFFDAQVSFVSGIEVQAGSQQLNVEFYDALIQLSGEINIESETKLYKVSFYDASVSITELWTDKPKAITNWAAQEKASTIWTDK